MSKPKDGASPICFVSTTACPEECRKFLGERDWFLSSGALDPNAECGSPESKSVAQENSPSECIPQGVDPQSVVPQSVDPQSVDQGLTLSDLNNKLSYLDSTIFPVTME